MISLSHTIKLCKAREKTSDYARDQRGDNPMMEEDHNVTARETLELAGRSPNFDPRTQFLVFADRCLRPLEWLQQTLDPIRWSKELKSRWDPM